MLRLRASKDRGYFDHGWLKTYHSFSFGDYQDANHIEFGSLRVINEDVIEAGAGFPTHGHRDMEIITYVMSGAVAHKDSTGGDGLLNPGEIQKMTAGRGVRHSEFNGRQDQDTHLYQIWIYPDQEGLPPSYEQRDYATALNGGEPVLLVSPEGKSGSIQIHQDVNLWARRLKPKTHWQLPLPEGRLGWLQVLKGDVKLNDLNLQAGDGVAIQNESKLELDTLGAAEVLFFDMRKIR